MSMLLRVLGVVMALLLPALPARAATELILWHAMPGKLGLWIDDLATGFNARQNEYVVRPQYKGGYPETMAAALAAAKTGNPPHMVQVFEVGTATMMAARDLIKPVHEVMGLLGQPFDDRVFLPAITAFYSSQDGHLLSMPLNSSTPVLFYDKRAFRAAGLSDAPPATWPALESAALALLKAGKACGFTTQWQSWIQLENLSAWHDIPFASKQNGIGGYDIELKFNSPFHVHHIQKLADWVRNHVFVPHGHRDEALISFKNGECPMLFASSATLAELQGAGGGKEVGIGMLPVWPQVKWAPRNSIIGGATLWVLNGHDEAEYRGVAQFFDYISSPDIQAASHQRTGYLPITREAYSLSRRQGFYHGNPDAEVAIRQITLHLPTEHSKGVRLGNFTQIRDVIDQELDAVWAGRKDARTALDDAVRRGNALLREFNHQP